MPNFEVTVQRTVVHVAKITIEAEDEDAAAEAAIKQAEEDQGATKPQFEWELDYDDFDTIEVYEE